MVNRKLYKGIVFFTFCLFSIYGFTQDNTKLERKVRLKSGISISPGLITENTKTIQLHGFLGFRPKSGKIEIRGDAFYFLGSSGDRPRFSMNHQLYAGAFYSFSETKFQPYVGFQPGIAYSQSSEFGRLNKITEIIEYKKTLNPVGALAVGFDFYGQKLFFLFVETRYIFGKHKSDTYPVFLDELRFSFGLGFYI